MLIKICGVTRVEDAEAAAALGADAIGLNFWAGSPRRVTLAGAAEIASAVRGKLMVVGLFVDAGDDEIEAARRAVGLDVLQLHGEESPASCARLGADAYWKAVRRAEDVGGWSCRTYVLDAAVAGAVGGTGVEVERAVARQAVARAQVILAGGLRPETVAEVVRDVRPFGVDVASGVEASPGVKDPARVGAFVRAVREAEAG